MRAASTAPRDSRELAVRNQFFTPRYVVDFLVQNSLGRRLIDVDPDSPLLADLPLLIDPPTAKGAAADLNEVAVLDPACGSGHFLLAAYDLLERAWHQRASARWISAGHRPVAVGDRHRPALRAGRRCCGHVPGPAVLPGWRSAASEHRLRQITAGDGHGSR